MRAFTNIAKFPQKNNILMQKIIFLTEKSAFWTKNSEFDFEKKKSILAFQIPALEVHKKGAAASIYRCGHLLIDEAASIYRCVHL